MNGELYHNESFVDGFGNNNAENETQNNLESENNFNQKKVEPMSNHEEQAENEVINNAFPDNSAIEQQEVENTTKDNFESNETPLSEETPQPPQTGRGKGRRKKSKITAGTAEKGNSFLGQYGTSRRMDYSTSLPPGFNIESMRIPMDHAEFAFTEVPSGYEIRKPNRQEFFRVHPDTNYQINVYVIKEKIAMGENLWIINPKLVDELSKEIVPVNLRLLVNRDNKVFIWPLSIPLLGHSNPWSQSACEAAEMAKSKWTRLTPDTSEGKYHIVIAGGELSEPVWPEYSFDEILKVAFIGRIIDTRDHLFLQRLRGEI